MTLLPKHFCIIRHVLHVEAPATFAGQAVPPYVHDKSWTTERTCMKPDIRTPYKFCSSFHFRLTCEIGNNNFTWIFVCISGRTRVCVSCSAHARSNATSR